MFFTELHTPKMTGKIVNLYAYSWTFEFVLIILGDVLGTNHNEKSVTLNRPYLLAFLPCLSSKNEILLISIESFSFVFCSLVSALIYHSEKSRTFYVVWFRCAPEVKMLLYEQLILEQLICISWVAACYPQL